MIGWISSLFSNNSERAEPAIPMVHYLIRAAGAQEVKIGQYTITALLKGDDQDGNRIQYALQNQANISLESLITLYLFTEKNDRAVIKPYIESHLIYGYTMQELFAPEGLCFKIDRLSSSRSNPIRKLISGVLENGQTFHPIASLVEANARDQLKQDLEKTLAHRVFNEVTGDVPVYLREILTDEAIDCYIQNRTQNDTRNRISSKGKLSLYAFSSPRTRFLLTEHILKRKIRNSEFTIAELLDEQSLSELIDSHIHGNQFNVDLLLDELRERSARKQIAVYDKTIQRLISEENQRLDMKLPEGMIDYYLDKKYQLNLYLEDFLTLLLAMYIHDHQDNAQLKLMINEFVVNGFKIQDLFNSLPSDLKTLISHHIYERADNSFVRPRDIVDDIRRRAIYVIRGIPVSAVLSHDGFEYFLKNRSKFEHINPFISELWKYLNARGHELVKNDIPTFQIHGFSIASLFTEQGVDYYFRHFEHGDSIIEEMAHNHETFFTEFGHTLLNSITLPENRNENGSVNYFKILEDSFVIEQQNFDFSENLLKSKLFQQVASNHQNKIIKSFIVLLRWDNKSPLLFQGINLLLNVIGVQERLHENDNEILRLSFKGWNEKIVKILISYPQVRNNIDISMMAECYGPRNEYLFEHAKWFHLPIGTIFYPAFLSLLREKVLQYFLNKRWIEKLSNVQTFYDECSNEEKPFSLSMLSALNILQNRQKVLGLSMDDLVLSHEISAYMNSFVVDGAFDAERFLADITHRAEQTVAYRGVPIKLLFKGEGQTVFLHSQERAESEPLPIELISEIYPLSLERGKNLLLSEVNKHSIHGFPMDKVFTKEGIEFCITNRIPFIDAFDSFVSEKNWYLTENGQRLAEQCSYDENRNFDERVNYYSVLINSCRNVQDKTSFQFVEWMLQSSLFQDVVADNNIGIIQLLAEYRNGFWNENLSVLLLNQLAVESVAHSNDNVLLRSAVQVARIRTVEKLLSISSVLSNIDICNLSIYSSINECLMDYVKWNGVTLRSLFYRSYYPSFRAFFSDYVSKNLIKGNELENILNEYFQLLYFDECPRLLYIGYEQPSDQFSEEIFLILHLFQSPKLFSYLDYLTDPISFGELLEANLSEGHFDLMNVLRTVFHCAAEKQLTVYSDHVFENYYSMLSFLFRPTRTECDVKISKWLLNIPLFQKMAASNNNQLIREVGQARNQSPLLPMLSIEQDHNALAQLLEIKYVRDLAHNHDNEILRAAIRSWDEESIQSLVAIPDVQNNIKIDYLSGGYNEYNKYLVDHIKWHGVPLKAWFFHDSYTNLRHNLIKSFSKTFRELQDIQSFFDSFDIVNKPFSVDALTLLKALSENCQYKGYDICDLIAPVTIEDYLECYVFDGVLDAQAVINSFDSKINRAFRFLDVPVHEMFSDEGVRYYLDNRSTLNDVESISLETWSTLCRFCNERGREVFKAEIAKKTLYGFSIHELFTQDGLTFYLNYFGDFPRSLEYIKSQAGLLTENGFKLFFDLSIPEHQKESGEIHYFAILNKYFYANRSEGSEAYSFWLLTSSEFQRVASHGNNRLIRNAVRSRDENQFLQLLAIDTVQEKAHENGNALLKNAINRCRNLNMVQALVKLPQVVRNIDISMLENGTEAINALLFDHVKWYGFELPSIFFPGYYIELRNELIRNPRQFISLIRDIIIFYHSFPPEQKPFSEMMFKILTICQAHEAVKLYQARIANHNESAMSSRNANIGNIVAEHAQRLYGAKVTERGLDTIERELRGIILDDVISEYSMAPVGSDNHTAYLFLVGNKKKLVAGNNESLMDQARFYLSSTHNENHIAWRLYDRWAPTHDWPNLFSPSNNDSYRFKVACLYLGLIDPNVPLYYQRAIEPETFGLNEWADPNESYMSFEQRKRIFIGQLAEIRRAPRHKQIPGYDNPSCSSGTSTRMGIMGAGHPVLHLVDPISMIPHVIQNIFNELLRNKLEHKSDEEKEAYALALEFLSEKNLPYIVSSRDRSYLDVLGNSISIDHLFALRCEIDSWLPSEHGLFSLINEDLCQRVSPKVRNLDAEELVYVRRQLEDLCFAGVGQRLASNIRPVIEIDKVVMESVCPSDPFNLSQLKEELGKIELSASLNPTQKRMNAMRVSQNIHQGEEKQLLFRQVHAQLGQDPRLDGVPEPVIAFLAKVAVQSAYERDDFDRDNPKINASDLTQAYEKYRQTNEFVPISEWEDRAVETLTQWLEGLTISSDFSRSRGSNAGPSCSSW